MAIPAVAAEFQRQLLENAAPVVEAYKDVLNLDNEKAPKIEDAVERYQLAMMLRATEQTLGSQRKMQEATQTTAVFGTSYVQQMMGMVRQVFPRLVGKELVSIQPVDRPTAKVFKLDMLRDDGSNPDVFTSWQAYKNYANHTGGENAQIQKGMRIALTDSDISIGDPKKLITGASLELTQDLPAYHPGLNPMDLLQGAAVDEITREIDAELVAAVYAAAASNYTVTFGMQPPSGWSPEKWPVRLQRAILMANKAISSRKGVDATWMVCGPQAAMELQDLRSFTTAGAFPNGGERDSFGLQPIGTLDQRWTVLRSNYLPDNEIIIGRKGSSILDAGAFWLPYVPLFISDRQFNVNTQKFEQSYMSRYGLHVSSNAYFARIVLDEDSSGIQD